MFDVYFVFVGSQISPRYHCYLGHGWVVWRWQTDCGSCKKDPEIPFTALPGCWGFHGPRWQACSVTGTTIMILTIPSLCIKKSDICLWRLVISDCGWQLCISWGPWSFKKGIVLCRIFLRIVVVCLHHDTSRLHVFLQYFLNFFFVVVRTLSQDLRKSSMVGWTSWIQKSKYVILKYIVLTQCMCGKEHIVLREEEIIARLF